MALLPVLAGCYPPAQSGYSPTVVEQPQPVHFFYGTLIDKRPATLEYGYETGIGATVVPRFPWSAGIHFAGSGPVGAARLSAGPVDVLVEGSAPNLPAIEYTVLLDKGTYPPDPYLRPDPYFGLERKTPIIVVQNELPTDHQLQVNERVVVRVVGRSGRVMANRFSPGLEQLIAAGPMPIPLAVPAPCDPVEIAAGAC
ncbi:MAG TPA: hypothetical protein VET89_03860 [Stellaceae bacterium]|nr:hypothetical protein [Stellaceae bacterium]